MEHTTKDILSKILVDNTFLLGYRGSIAHNMYVPKTNPNSTDDIDMMGVFFAPVDHYIGIIRQKETVKRFIGRWDVVNYEFLKFVKLLTKSNPNVLSLLWLKDSHYIEKTAAGERLIANRDLFVSKKIYYSFTRYAYAQLKKMEKNSFEGYMGEKRKALVEKFGYDCKNAAHCIRLLKMGIEFLVEGRLNVFRKDASMLIDIKTGQWPLKEVKRKAKDLFKLADEAYVKTSLPSEPKYDEINKMVVEIMKQYICGKGGCCV